MFWNGLTVFSSILAMISLYLGFLSIKSGKDSLEQLETVKRELGIQLDNLASVNTNTQSLLTQISELVDSSEKAGLEKVYINRNAALQEFTEYIKKENGEIVIVGSSLLGLSLLIADFEELVRIKANKLKFILTHPEYSQKRELPEGRDNGIIKREILEHLTRLREWGVPESNIQLYKGSPTVFMISTENHMLLNPYPYGTEAYRGFCLLVSSQGAIFSQYRKNHFDKIWDSQSITSFREFTRNIGDVVA